MQIRYNRFVKYKNKSIQKLKNLVAKVFICHTQFVNQLQPSLRCGLESRAKQDLLIITMNYGHNHQYHHDHIFWDPEGVKYDQFDNGFGVGCSY